MVQLHRCRVRRRFQRGCQENHSKRLLHQWGRPRIRRPPADAVYLLRQHKEQPSHHHCKGGKSKVYPWTPGTKSLLPLSKAKRSHLMRAKTRASTCRCKHTVGAVKPLCGLFWRRTASNPLREFKPNLRRFRADVQTGDDAHSEDFRQGRKSSRRKRGGLRLHPPLGHSGRQCRPHKGFCAFEALFYRLGCGTAMSENCRLQPPKTPCLQPLYRRLRA